VRSAIDDTEIAQIAEQLGVSREEAADAIAKVLPELVDRVSPEGQLPEQADLDALFEKVASAAQRA
jgi:uncharacterized protein YidB (DUF937 family)